MFTNAHVNVDAILAENDIESIYQKFFSDILHLSKNDNSTTSFFSVLAQEVVAFLNSLGLEDKEQFNLKKMHLSNRLRVYKEHNSVKNHADIARILQRVETDILDGAKDLKAKLFNPEYNDFKAFISTIEAIYLNHTAVTQAVPTLLCSTGGLRVTSRSSKEIISDKLAQTIDQEPPVTQISLSLNKAECAKELFQYQKHSQSIVKCYEALDTLKAIDPKHQQTEQYQNTLQSVQLLLASILDSRVDENVKTHNFEEAIQNLELELAALGEMQNMTDAVLKQMMDCQLTLAGIYNSRVKQLNDDAYDEKIRLYSLIIEAANMGLAIAVTHESQLEEVEDIKNFLLKAYYHCSEVFSDIEDYKSAIHDARLAIVLSKELSSDEEYLKKYTNHLSMIERDFFAALHQVVVEQTDNELEIPASEESAYTKKRKSSPYLNTYRTKRQKLLNENGVMVADILSRPEEVLHIIDDIDFEDPQDFVDFYKYQTSYDKLKDKVEKSFHAITNAELTCFCLPFLFGNINEMSDDTLSMLLSKAAADKLSEHINKSFKLIQYVFQYQQAIQKASEKDQQSLTAKIHALLMSANEHTLSKAYENFNLSNAFLAGIHLPDVRLDFAYLNGITLTSSDLTNASLANAKLCCARFDDAILRTTSFSGAELQGSDFRNAQLEGSNLSFANCKSCNFTNANLSRTILIGVDFTNANLQNANLTGAQFIPKYTFHDGSYTKELFLALDSYKDHKQKDLLFTALIEDVLTYLTLNQFRAVLREYKDQQQTTNNNFTFFNCESSVDDVIAKLANYQSSFIPAQASAQPDDPKEHPTPH